MFQKSKRNDFLEHLINFAFKTLLMMKSRLKTKNILPFNWRTELGFVEVDSIDNDLILLDKPIIKSIFQYPFRIDVTAVINMYQGNDGRFNKSEIIFFRRIMLYNDFARSGYAI